MPGSRSENVPIRLIATFNDVAIPGPGFEIPLATAMLGNRTELEPVRMFPTIDVWMTESQIDLTSLVVQKIRQVTSESFSPGESLLIESWFKNQSEQDVAALLNITPEAVRIERQRLLERIRISIEPPRA